MDSPPASAGAQPAFAALRHRGLRAFSGLTVGMLGSLIGVHWSLALSALALLAASFALLAFSMRSG